MTSSSAQSTSELDPALEHYANLLENLEKATSNSSEEQAVSLLIARDEVEALLPKDNQVSAENLAKIIKLDSRLKKQAQAIAKDNQLAKYRQLLKPPESSWWWFLEPAPPKTNPYDKFDWAWNGLTMLCLAGASSFIVSTSQALSADGFDIGHLFQTIVQTTGVAFVAGGSLTSKGQETFAKILSSLKIPPHFQSEAIFGASVVLLLAAFSVNKSLPAFGNRYYKQGKQAYNQGQLAQALNKYKKALNLNPDDLDIKIGLGNIYNTLGELDEAKSYYQQGVIQKDPASLNGIGTVILQQDSSPPGAFKAEGYFRLALHQKDLPKDLSPGLEAKIRSNIARALFRRSKEEGLSQEKVNALLDDAEKQLRKAIELIPSISKDALGRGMAHCYLKVVLKERGDNTNAKKQEQLCTEATPETLEEFQVKVFDQNL